MGVKALFGNRSGQMMVELAVTIPAMLALLGIAVNVMVFLGDCARFDRLAAEAVRVYAVSPRYGEYGITARAQAVESALEEAFDKQGNLSFEVSSEAGATRGQGEGTAGDIVVSFLAGTERFTCTMRYRPWGFGDSFFGISFSGIRHSRSYVVAPFKPGVLI